MNRKLLKIWTATAVYDAIKAEAVRRGETVSGLCRQILTVFGQELNEQSKKGKR